MLKVIGIGYPRTASHSLKLALEELGFGPCHHMTEVFPRPERWQYWVDATEGKPVDWDAVFEGFSSTTDAPACYFYKELIEKYPDAKVIHTVRDPDKWAESAANTVLGQYLQEGIAGTVVGDWLDKVFFSRYADVDGIEGLKAKYAAHNQAVIDTVPADRLLVYEIGSGWEPICEFLGVPVPDTPYPRVNDRQQFGELAEHVIKAAHGEA